MPGGTIFNILDLISPNVLCGMAESLLESILSKEACQKQLPTLDSLTEHRFFAEYTPRFNEQYSALIASNRPHFKLSAAAKEQMKIATQKIEQRLQNEQKSVSVTNFAQFHFIQFDRIAKTLFRSNTKND